MLRKQVFPFICILLYVLFTITDTYTTYLATPDLKYEANPIYLYFKWGWSTQLLYISFMVVLTILVAILSNRYVINYYDGKKRNTQKAKLLLIICFLLLTYCYYNVIGTFECTLNNWLNYRYLYVNRETLFQHIAVSYVEFYSKFNKTFGDLSFMYVVTAIETLIATLVTFLRFKSVKKHIKLKLSLQ